MLALVQMVPPSNEDPAGAIKANLIDWIGIDFAGRWDDWVDARHLDGLRVIGVLDFRSTKGQDNGVLCKRMHGEGYAIVTRIGPLELPLTESEVDQFLLQVRKGRGGRGRGQGRASTDGVCYPKHKEVTIGQNMVMDLMKLGSSLSEGIRAAVGRADVEACKQIEDPGGAVTRCKIYLDMDSLDKLAVIGDKNVSRGIRRVWALLCARTAAETVPLPPVSD